MFTFTLNNFLSGKMISIYLAASAFCLLLALIILSGWDFPLCDKVYHCLQLAWFGGQIRKKKRKRKTGKKKKAKLALLRMVMIILTSFSLRNIGNGKDMVHCQLTWRESANGTLWEEPGLQEGCLKPLTADYLQSNSLSFFGHSSMNGGSLN